MTALFPTTSPPVQARPWFASYPPGVPHSIEDQLGGTINDLLAASFAAYPGRTMIESFGVRLSYARIAAVRDAVAGWLQAAGLGPGDKIAIMLPNVAAYMPIAFGALKAGCTVVNVNPLYTPRELVHQMKDSGARTIFVLAQFEHTVKAAKAETPIDRVVRVRIGDLLGFKGLLVNFVAGRKSKIDPNGRIDGAIDFKAVIAGGSRHRFRPVAVAADDIAFLQYTGGTTGVSKGAALRHSNLIANVAQCGAWFHADEAAAQEPQDVMVTALPLYHIFALTACCLHVVRHGACSLLITNPRDIPGFITTLRTSRFTMISGVNTLFNALAEHRDFKTIDFKQLKLSLAGGMAVQRAVAEKWKRLTGTPIIEGYGLSETSPGVCFNRPDIADFTGTVGLPWPSTDVSIRNADGAEVPYGSVGELCVKGPQVMAGYWNRPDETAKVMTADGYFRTGDLATMSPAGEIKIVDRLKEMIIVSGFNVYPNEIEDVIVKHPKVLEAAVIGLPDPHSGECVCAYVVKRDDSLTADEVKAFCHQWLTNYKVPKHVTFRAELPKSNVGKVLRRAIREEVTKASA